MTEQRDDGKSDAVDDALACWRQGDCVVGEQWFVHRFSVETPLTEGASAVAKAGVDLAESKVAGFAVTSQTCDIVRSCTERPYVEVAPLVPVDESDHRSIARGRRPRYASIPGLKNQGLVADLDRMMTVEKVVVAAWSRAPGCGTNAEARRLGQALARKRTRWAFPDDFTRLAGKLQSRLQEKHAKRSDEGAALRALREIRVRAAPWWESGSVEIMFWFIHDEDKPSFDGHRWDEFLESWLKLVPPKGRFNTVDGAALTLDDLTARDYVERDALDLDHLSAGPA